MIRPVTKQKIFLRPDNDCGKLTVLYCIGIDVLRGCTAVVAVTLPGSAITETRSHYTEVDSAVIISAREFCEESFLLQDAIPLGFPLEVLG